MKASIGEKDVYAMSKEECESFHLERSHVVISINDPHSKPPSLMPNCWRRGTLCLWFENVSGAGAMQDADAKRIWRFVEASWPDIEAIIVHCSLGMTRSPAVAAAITRAKGGEDEVWFSNCSPSRAIYHKLMSAAVDEGIIKA